ncbi:MAG: sulfatase-like hydrolase/transferase [Candidatus Latescibacteria bacterium]|nr:sulfatase-like hydrolase/transferase [Candidatus Latescibacterota bacterium]
MTVNAAIEFIRRHFKSGQPFFAVVWFGSPHNPHIALDADRQLYNDQSEQFQHFYGEITAMDRAFGKLRSELKTLGIKDNTLLWYCSDNGGLPNLGSTGGRGFKGQIYDGGLRVPAIIEWPERITAPRVTDVPCNTTDIYLTLLQIAGITYIPGQTPVDGISLVNLIDGKITSRSKPMGFWDYPIAGISTPSHQWMMELLEAQKDGDPTGDTARLRLNAGDITKQYPEDDFPGHAAWLDWPWKLHRIQGENGDVTLELYNLSVDAGENNNLVNSESDRVANMRPALEKWLTCVVQSLNGKDYEDTWLIPE